jgi:hypothetical protein
MACAGRDANGILTVQYTRGWRWLDVEDDVDVVDVGVDEVGVEEAVTSGREYASQKPDRRHPCRPSENWCWFGDTALPRSAARRTEEGQKLGRRRAQRSRWENELWRESSRQKDVSFYREDPELPMFRSTRYPGTTPWYLSTSSHEAAARSRTCLSRSEGWRGSLSVGDVGQNKTVRKRETPVRNPS